VDGEGAAKRDAEEEEVPSRLGGVWERMEEEVRRSTRSRRKQAAGAVRALGPRESAIKWGARRGV
jgi:hypothetical protein